MSRIGRGSPRADIPARCIFTHPCGKTRTGASRRWPVRSPPSPRSARHPRRDHRPGRADRRHADLRLTMGGPRCVALAGRGHLPDARNCRAGPLELVGPGFQLATSGGGIVTYDRAEQIEEYLDLAGCDWEEVEAA